MQAFPSQNTAAPNRTGNDSIDNSIGHATPTGSTDTAVARFAAGANSPIGGFSYTEVNTAANGTIVSIVQPGIYQVDYNFCFTGAVLVAGGIGLGMAGAAITADPVVGTNGVIAAADMDSNASMTLCCSLTTTFPVRAQLAATPATIRFLMTDSAGGAPVGVVAASVQYRMRRLFGVAF
jgi:hypothetical protein